MFTYARAAIGLGVLLLAIWAFRVDGLRSDHLQKIDDTVHELKEAGLAGANRDNVAAVTKTLASQRNQARTERDQARTLVETQSNAITVLQNETAEYIRNAEAQQRMIAETTRQRDIWIARARSASTRTQRLSAEEEVKQCEAVLDSLYSQGF